MVVVNTGFGHFGMVEELTEDELRNQMETNLFGAVRVTQAVLPIMREQVSGHLIQVSSIGGISAVPTVGDYHASKWALEGLSQSLSQEVAGSGKAPLDIATKDYEARLATWNEWQPVALQAQGCYPGRVR